MTFLIMMRKPIFKYLGSLLLFAFGFFSYILVFAQSEVEESSSNLVDYLTLEKADIGKDYVQQQLGVASHYAKRFHSRKTANGERFDMNGFSAAHKTLPFGTIVRVTNNDNNNSTLVRINDRGPFVRGRIIDLSYESAKYIGALGIDDVKVDFIVPGTIEIPDENQKYYSAYSLNHPIACLPENRLLLIDSTDNFSDALAIYNQKFHMDSEFSPLFLFVEANKVETKKSKVSYYIGLYNGKEFKRKTNMVAEKP